MASSNSFHIVIAGAGIAGLATAIALRGPNRRITILEKSRMNKETGALISLQPNASKIVTRWGLERFLEKYEPIIDREFRIFDTTGQLHHTVKLDAEMYGANRVCYHRQDLHSALKEAATSPELPGEPATIRTASPVVSCDCEAGSITLENGEVIQGDLVIGADGIHSVIRSAVVGSTVEPVKTGISAYRMLIESSTLEDIQIPKDVFDPKRPVTTMIVGHDRRIIMGPGRGGKVYGIVALVPDEHMHEDSASNSWNAEGSMAKLLESYAQFPGWVKEIFTRAPDLALWQLRDLNPLTTWTRGRTIIIGDASHAMLPTQGQGASQSIEDAEALQAFFSGVEAPPSAVDVQERLERIVTARMERASLIQAYSRQQAKPASEGVVTKVQLNPAQFMDYNCRYDGARDWWQKHSEVKV